MNESRDRLLYPMLVPIAAILALAFVILAFSRILLAVPKEATTPIALAIALNVLTAGTLLAMLPRLRSKALVALMVVGALGLGAGGVVSMAVSGELKELREFFAKEEPAAEQPASEEQATSGHTPGASTPTIVAKSITFDLVQLVIPAGKEFSLEFDNQDTGIPHNVAIYTEESGEALFTGDQVTEPTTYAIPPLEAGSYYFQCDVHPAMNGSVSVA